MLNKLAVAGALCCAAASPAVATDATSLTPGIYKSIVYVNSLTNAGTTGKVCADAGFTAAKGIVGIAKVAGAGKPMLIRQSFANDNDTAEVFVDYAFDAFPQTITDPVAYSGPAVGLAGTVDAGYELQLGNGTINTIGPNQFKITAPNVTLTYHHQPVCTMSIDSTFLRAGP